jgi:acyl-CoA thioesterase I
VRGPARTTIAAALLIAGCGGHHDVAPPTRAPESAKLVVVGDSLAFGRFADTQEDAFPQRVAAATHAQLEVLAAPGITTAQLAAQTIPAGGATVVVEAGTNDFLTQTPRKRFAADYEALLAKVKAASPKANLICLTLWIPKDAPGRIPASSYDATIRRDCSDTRDIAPLYGAPGMRGPAGRPTFLGPGDDFHPNSNGHAAIARLIESRR